MRLVGKQAPFLLTARIFRRTVPATRRIETHIVASIVSISADQSSARTRCRNSKNCSTSASAQALKLATERKILLWSRFLRCIAASGKIHAAMPSTRAPRFKKAVMFQNISFHMLWASWPQNAARSCNVLPFNVIILYYTHKDKGKACRCVLFSILRKAGSL